MNREPEDFTPVEVIRWVAENVHTRDDGAIFVSADLQGDWSRPEWAANFRAGFAQRWNGFPVSGEGYTVRVVCDDPTEQNLREIRQAIADSIRDANRHYVETAIPALRAKKDADARAAKEAQDRLDRANAVLNEEP